MAPHSTNEFSDNIMLDIGNASTCSMTSSERRARFSLNMEEKVIMIESHKDYSPEEFKQTYWTINEQGKLRDEQLGTIARMEKGKKPKKEDYRGLESEEVALEFQQKRDKCLRAVLKAQAQNGNADSLAIVSQNVTAESTKKALKLAQADAEDAENVWNTEPPKRRKSLPQRMLSKFMKSNSLRF